ncbi:phosphotransferase enzyme family protein [Stemphylium lycopersici]|uniref:Phosphotransferase enzyme family protein n=1 Tax=Stemphylium lycopersici TaxID=183478 RepID=A0A364MUQ9_STELY|nr:aminoglycoside phosphotransferase [Stemphylium lycopersici]RAR03419.1 phosphotransferase enzyme family protein [Stemphylium lycopersici]RAR03543.1 phosphotransferase enzyme family protein [Stemphylium lycopersici]
MADSFEDHEIVGDFTQKKGHAFASTQLWPTTAIQSAAMPELYDPMPSSPRINVLYLAPGQIVISPQQLEESNPENIAIGGGSRLARKSPTMCVKYGTHASLIKAKNMLYVTENTSIPVPKLFAAYAYGPIDREVGDFGSVYNTHIFMEHMEGEDLRISWEKHTTSEKQTTITDLKSYVEELRALQAPGYIGPAGPFKSQAELNTTIANAYIAKSKGQAGPYIRGMLDAHKHGIVFTHGDLRPDNIIVKDGRITGIIDWEMSGWYPDYWEFAKAFYVEHFANDWKSSVGVSKCVSSYSN